MRIPKSFAEEVGLSDGGSIELRRVSGGLLIEPSIQVNGYPFEVPIPSGLPVGGVVLSDQAKCLDWRAREADTICRLPPETTLEVLRRLSMLVGA